MADKVDNRGTYHITDYPDIYEPARNNNFEFLIPEEFKNDKTILKSGLEKSISDNDYIKNGQEVVRVAVESSSVPHFKLGIIEVKRGNNTAKFAGLPTFDSGSLVVKDFISVNAYYSNPKDVLMAWQALAYNVKSEKISRASVYKKTCKLVEYSPDWNIVRQWTLEGCWVSEISEDAFTTESEGKRTFTATIVYDKAYLTYDAPTTTNNNQ